MASWSVVRALEKAKGGGFPSSILEKPKSDSISSLEGISEDSEQDANSEGDLNGHHIQVDEAVEFMDGQSNSNQSFERPSKRMRASETSSDIKSERA